jgi:integrase
VLEDHELAVVWKACGQDEFGKVIWLLILTGCRRAEIGGMRWSEIDLDKGTWTFRLRGPRTAARTPCHCST